MTDLIAKLASFMQPIGLTAILVYVYGYFSRANASIKTTEIVMGVVFGFAAITAMASPIEVSPGVMIDMRNLFVGISAAFFGWRGGSITLAITIATRLNLGGEGAHIGAIAAIISGMAGLFWHLFVSPRIPNIFVSLPILASLISLHIGATYMLPVSVRIMVLHDLAPMVLMLNFAGTGVFALLIFREIALVDQTNRLLTEATTDPLTRVMNRRSAIKIYSNNIHDKPPQKGVAMACIDVDNFKKTNDRYGHLAGDHVLVVTASRIATCLRKHDVFCRMSGDEFLIVMTDVTHTEASAISERCREIIAEKAMIFNGQAIRTSISIGTVWADIPPDFVKFRNNADDALYEAKAMGRDYSSFSVHATDTRKGNAA